MTSAAELVDTLKKLGLLSTDQLNSLSREQGGFADARACASELNRRGWLTFFQMDQLIAGKGADLRLGPYVILERLGAGGLGTVYKARHARMGRVVALKVIRKDAFRNAAEVQRFQREIEVAAQLTHPSTVQAYAADQMGDVHYFAMEFIDGLDLFKRVKHRGPLPVAEACEYLRQAAEGLQHAHALGLVHGDLSPANLIVTSGSSGQAPVVKILDLGLSGETAQRLTRDSADYLAPEQCSPPARADARTDLYSLGCTSYYLLTGKPPFPGGTVAEKLERQRRDQPPPLDQLRPDVPRELCALVHRLLAKKPEERFQSAGEVAQALAGLREPMPQFSWQGLVDQLKKLLTFLLTRLYRLVRGYPRATAAALLLLLFVVVLIRVTREETERPHAALGYTLKKHPRQAAHFNRHWYLFVPERVATWEEAQDKCKQRGGYLVCINSTEENDFLLGLTGGNNFWLGGRSDEERRWYWISGEPFTFTAWGRGQPNNGAGAYLEMYRGSWHDIGGVERPSYAAGYICEFDF